MFELRDYQTDCVNTILDRFQTLDSQIVQLPTGAGKTVILWHVLKSLNKRALIIAPTRELTEQLEETGQSVVSACLVYRKKRSYWPSGAQYLVMTCQAATFAQKGEELDKFNPEILIVDEAHRSRSPSLEGLIKAYINKGVKILGLTATPERLDGKSLLDIYQDLTYSVRLIDLIKLGYLVDLECYRIKTKHKIQNMRTHTGDISPAALKELDVAARNQIVLEVYKNYCLTKKTLVFCLNVAHAETMENLFMDNGIKSCAIHGGLSITRRQAILKLFKDGDIDVLFNCQLLTEGFDEPSIEVLILARPTKSKALYCQMIGRGVRPFHNKDRCFIYDLTDELHNIRSFNVLGDIPDDSFFEFNEGEKLTEAVERHKLARDDIDYDIREFSLYEQYETEPIPVGEHQKFIMADQNIPFLDDITMDQAAYLLFKTDLLRKHGIDPRAYWEEWRENLQLPGET